MKRLFKILILTALSSMFIFLFACSSSINAMPEEMPQDFSFALNWGAYGVSSYDSLTGKLVKTTNVYLHDPEDYVCTLILPDELTEEIYDILRDMNPADYPEEYNPNNGIGADPPSWLILTVRYGGEELVIKCTDVVYPSSAFPQLTPSYGKKGSKFMNACLFIIQTVYSTDEWQSLPDYDFYYY